MLGVPDEAGGSVSDASTELAVQHVTQILHGAEYDATWRVAKGLAMSAFFKDASGNTDQQVAKAFTKVMIGRDLGISPTQAMMSIDLVKGSIMLRGVLLASFVRRSTDYEYKTLVSTHEAARILMLGFPLAEKEDGMVRFRGMWWEPLGEVEFTVEDARKAGLPMGPGSAWASHPKNMLMWRALSNGVKFHAPDLMGGVPVYIEGEIVPDNALTTGTGTGEPANVELPAEVEAVLTRAQALGHTAVADRGSAAMAANTQMPAEDIEQWVTMATSVLDGYELDQARDEMTEADVVPDA
jgi:hypothetical protein